MYVSLFSRVHNVQCASELQVRVPGQSQAGQGGEEGAEGEGEGSNQHPVSGQEISLSLPTPKTNKVQCRHFFFISDFICQSSVIRTV